MPNLKPLLKDTAIYGLSSIVGRFLNYLLVPLYTHYMPTASGDYGVTTNVYAYTALILVILVFGMETTLFRYANDAPPADFVSKGKNWPDTVFSTGFALIVFLTALFLFGVFGYITPISNYLGYADHPEYLLMMAMVVAMDALQSLPFSYLRFRKRPIRFATLKLIFIVVNIGLNLIFFALLHKTQAFYPFAINLFCTSLITLLFIPELLKIQWHFDVKLLFRMLSYSWPILVLGVAGILNQVADKIIFPLVYPDKSMAHVELGIYGSCVKVAMVMSMITQAFRYAYEPIVFAKAKDGDKGEYYAATMKYFILFVLFAFLCVMGYIDLLQRLIGAGYREGMKVVPIVMAAEIMMGIYFNLSFWYKLIDRTIYGALFSLVGCVMLFAVNIYYIPEYGYMACAWGGVAGYGTAMLLSYVVGQWQNPIPYPMKRITAAIVFAALCYGLMTLVPSDWHIVFRLAIHTLLIGLYVAYVVWTEFRQLIPLRWRQFLND